MTELLTTYLASDLITLPTSLRVFKRFEMKGMSPDFSQTEMMKGSRGRDASPGTVVRENTVLGKSGA